MKREIRILSDTPLPGLADLLTVAARPWGLELEVSVSALSADTASAAAAPADILILLPDLRTRFPEFFVRLLPMPCSEIQAHCDRIIHDLAGFVDGFRGKPTNIIIANFAAPIHLDTRLFDAQNSAGQLAWIAHLNQRLAGLSETTPNALIFPLEHTLYRSGAERAFDTQRFFMSGVPFTPEFLEKLAQEVARFIRAICQPRKKCLVVDLDNTLWGGVLGEEGLSGIKLGGPFPGNVFQEIQREISQIADQGIWLAISSKNDEAIVREAFEQHAGMVLAWNDFAARRIDWNDKASHLRSIAAELCIGTESLIFVDDNPFEVELVRRLLPEVHAVPLTADPVAGLKILQTLPGLDFLQYDADAIRRKHHAEAQTSRAAFQSQFASIEEAYRAFGMRARIRIAQETDAARIAELTQKTNQFNLTARRYTVGEILAFLHAPQIRVYALWLEDRFGDNGLTGTAIVREKGRVWELDTFLLSCRIIGRGADRALLARVMQDARERSVATITGRDMPTERNALARDFFREMGFCQGDGIWRAAVEEVSVRCPAWIESGDT